MRAMFAIPSLLMIAACQSVPLPTDVGSTAWMERVDRELRISDGQGHGPDYGSQEWCNVVHFRLYGRHATEPVACDRQWMQEVDRTLRVPASL